VSVLITGASGFVGRHVVAAMEPTEEVWALAHAAVPADHRGAHWITADLASSAFVTTLPARVDTVVHLAQSAHYRDFPERAADIFAVNAASTALLLDWAQRAGVRRFILASAGGANRVTPAAGLDYYLATKRCAELLTASYRTQFAVTVLRFFFVYGAGQRPTMLMPRLVDAVRDGRPVTLSGEHGLRLNPIHVSDAVRAVVRATEIDATQEFDVAGPEVLTLRAIADIISDKLGRKPQYVADVSGKPDDLIGDIRAMCEQLAAPRVRFEDGVDDLIAVHGRYQQQ
jgi:UDP-glucose 4-epimerase